MLTLQNRSQYENMQKRWLFPFSEFFPRGTGVPCTAYRLGCQRVRGASRRGDSPSLQPGSGFPFAPRRRECGVIVSSGPFSRGLSVHGRKKRDSQVTPILSVVASKVSLQTTGHRGRRAGPSLQVTPEVLLGLGILWYFFRSSQIFIRCVFPLW